MNQRIKRRKNVKQIWFQWTTLLNMLNIIMTQVIIPEELTKLFLAIYFLFEKMQKQNEMERYNDKIIQNYYDPDRIEKRDHPLDAQRILYLYDMLNIVIVTDKIKMLPVKEEIINILKSIKRLSNVDLPKREMEYLIAEESIQNLKKTLQDIRVKIPRLGSNSEK